MGVVIMRGALSRARKEPPGAGVLSVYLVEDAALFELACDFWPARRRDGGKAVKLDANTLGVAFADNLRDRGLKLR